MCQPWACLCDNSFKLGSSILNQSCKRPWVRFLLFCGAIDLYLQGQVELESQNLSHFEFVHTIPHHQLKLGFPSLDQKCILPLFRSLWILGLIGIDLLFDFDLKTYSKLSFLYVLMRPITGFLYWDHGCFKPPHLYGMTWKACGGSEQFKEPLEQLFAINCFTVWPFLCATGRRPFLVGVWGGIGGPVFLLFGTVFWSTLLAKSNGVFFVFDFWKLSYWRNVFNFGDNMIV